MKKTIIFALIAALVAVAPVSAAGLDFGGSIETKIEVKKQGEDVQVSPKSEFTMDLGLSAAQDKVRAGLEFGLDKENTDLMPSGITLGEIALKQAYIEADGAFWHGGPEATTRFGTLDIDYSPYASLQDRSGVSISGVDLDVVELNGFYALEGIHGHVFGLRSDLNLLDGVAVGASVIKDDEITRLQLDAAGAPIEGLHLEGSIAADHTADSGINMNNLWAVKAAYELAENTNITAGYKHITADHDPRYIAEPSEDGDAEHDWVYPENRVKNSGLFVGFETEQQGVEFNAAYDQMVEEAKLGAGTEYEGFRFDVATVLAVPSVSGISTKTTTFGVGREFEVMDGLAIDASYKGKWTGGDARTLVHTIGASTTLGIIPAIDGLELNAEVSASELSLDSVGYKVGAKFAAPNGVNLGIEHSRADGTTFDASMKVEF